MASTKIPRICESCSNPFMAAASEVKKGWGRFCSIACKGQAMRVARVAKTCENCTAEFLVDQWEARNRPTRFCSQKCLQMFRITSLECVCENCTKTFTRPPSQIKKTGTFCSKECWYEYAAIPIAERFPRYVGPPTETGCTLWQGAVNEDGYGLIDSGPPDHKNLRAHRVAFTLGGGVLPDDLDVLHTCDTPPCVAFPHLFSGTQTDNNRDRDTKGRAACGERQGHAKLTEAVIRAAKQRIDAGESSCAQEAAQAGVNHTTMSLAVTGETWRHLNLAQQEAGTT